MRILVALLFVGVPQLAVSAVLRRSPLEDPLALAATLVLVHLAYLAYVRLVEQRPAGEVALRAAPAGLAWGALTGAALISAMVAVLWLLGYYQVTGTGALAVLGPAFIISAQSGYVEELIMRGIVFRIAEEGIGTWLAILLSALIFGFLHAFNPNATLVSSLSIAASAGVLLAGVYAFARRLWPVVGLHFAWNFTLGGVYGIPVSGFPMKGLLQSRTAGPELLTGGAFGLEASILVPVSCLALAAFFLARAAQAGRLLAPSWKRRRAAAEPGPAAQLVAEQPAESPRAAG